MDAKDLIGRTIVDILCWFQIEDDWLDVVEVYLKLDNNETIQFPFSFNSKDLIESPPEDSISLFEDLNDFPVYHLNQEKKSIQDIVDAKKKRDESLLGLIKRAFGITENIPREYVTYEIEYKENKLKYLQDQKIVDLIDVEHSDALFLELENGYIITIITVSPQGTGRAGLNYFENLTDFEERNTKEFKRFNTERK